MPSVDRVWLGDTRSERPRVQRALTVLEVTNSPLDEEGDALRQLDLALERWQPTGATSRDPNVQKRLSRLLAPELASVAAVKEAVLFLRRDPGLPRNEVNALMDALRRARAPSFASR